MYVCGLCRVLKRRDHRPGYAPRRSQNQFCGEAVWAKGAGVVGR